MYNFGGLLGQLQNANMPGMGLGSPRFQNGMPMPSSGLMGGLMGGMPQQNFTPDRWNSMSPQNMSMLGMNPNMPNMVGPTSALPANMQPQASQLPMYGMQGQSATQAPQQSQAQPGSAATSLADALAYIPKNLQNKTVLQHVQQDPRGFVFQLARAGAFGDNPWAGTDPIDLSSWQNVIGANSDGG